MCGVQAHSWREISSIMDHHHDCRQRDNIIQWGHEGDSGLELLTSYTHTISSLYFRAKYTTHIFNPTWCQDMEGREKANHGKRPKRLNRGVFLANSSWNTNYCSCHATRVSDTCCVLHTQFRFNTDVREQQGAEPGHSDIPTCVKGFGVCIPLKWKWRILLLPVFTNRCNETHSAGNLRYVLVWLHLTRYRSMVIAVLYFAVMTM